MWYKSMLDAGESVALAHMLASQTGPMLSGDTTQKFDKAQRAYMEGLSQGHRDILHQRARMAGINPGGKYYVPGLGPENPRAWVTSPEEAKSAFEAAGLSTEEGSVVTVKSKPAPPKPAVRLAPEIVQECVDDYIKSEPKTAEKVRKNKRHVKELQERAMEEHAPKTSTYSGPLSVSESLGRQRQSSS